MTINGTNIDTFHGKQHKVTYSYPERDVSYEWPTGGANPTFHRNTPGMDTLSLEIIVSGTTRSGIRSDIRQILGLFNVPYVIIAFDEGGFFLGALQNSGTQETKPQRWHKLVLSLRGLFYQSIYVEARAAHQLPVSLNVDASPIGGCQGIFTFASDTLTDATITISGLAHDKKGAASDISFRLHGLPGDGTNVTVYVGELPMGTSYVLARENPTLLSLADGTPIDGSVGAMPRMIQGRNTVSVAASDLSYDDGTGEADTSGAVITCEFYICYLSVVST
jgi:hypothetical protein